MKTTMLLFATLLLSMHQNSAAESGKATMYGGNLDGNACGMDGTADAYGNWKYAAIGSTNFDDGYGCGKCYTITCIGPYGDNPSCSCSGSITVQAIDQCPECDENHFDLNADALAYLTGDSADMAGLCGVVEITYERVHCDDIDTNFKVTNKGGTSKFWYGFHLDDVDDDGGIKSVELLKDGSSIATCDKSGGPSFWLCNNGGSLSEDTPLDIKITSDLGVSVTASDCITSFSGGEEMRCNTNLGGGSTDTDSDDDEDEDEDEDEDDDDQGDDGTIKIKVNSNSNVWWMAIEFPNSDNDEITKFEFRDSNHGSWVSGAFEEWGSGAYSFNDGTEFSGSQHFRVTTDDGTAITWNVFSDLSAGSTAYINLPGGDSYTEEGAPTSASTSVVAGIIAAVLLAFILLNVIGYCIIKRRKQKAEVVLENKTEDSDVRMQDGDSVGTPASAGYDMSPVNTTAV